MFFLDRLTVEDSPLPSTTKPGEKSIDAQYEELKRNSSYNSKVYGIFGYFKAEKYSYLILIETATIIGNYIGAIVYRVDKLQYVPLSTDGSLDIPSEDQPYIQMIEKVQAEKAFYFSYDIDLTKNMQRTFQDIKKASGEARRHNNDTRI